MSDSQQMKQLAAKASLVYINSDTKLGIGTGSTCEELIKLLNPDNKPACIVSSSERSQKLLVELGFEVIELKEAGVLDVYIDGADEFTDRFTLIKGGGGAHTREKILAYAAKQFVVIAGEDKKVEVLGKFPVAVEVLPMARSLVARKLITLGAEPSWREGFTTDEGNQILDCRSLDVSDTAELESNICSIAGVVDCGLFGIRRADVIIVGQSNGEVTKMVAKKV